MGKISAIINLIKNSNKKATNCKTQNVIISVDAENSNVKIATVLGVDASLLKVKEHSFCAEFLTEQFFEEFVNILKTYAATVSEKSKNCYLILPDSLFTMDSVTLPQLKGKIFSRALSARLQKDYKNIKNLLIKSAVLAKNKKTVTYSVRSVNAQVIYNFINAIKNVGLNLKSITFNANCVANYVLNARQDLKKKNVIITNVNANNTDFIAVNNQKLVAFSRLKKGYQVLCNSQNVKEEFNYFIKWAQIYAQNANLGQPCSPIEGVIFNLPQSYFNLIEEYSLQSSGIAYSALNIEKDGEFIGAILNFDEELNFYEKI